MAASTNSSRRGTRWSWFVIGVGADQERLRSFFAAEFPREARLRASWPNHFFFRITPAWARYSDFTDEPPRVLTLDFVTDTETRGTWPVTSAD